MFQNILKKAELIDDLKKALTIAFRKYLGFDVDETRDVRERLLEITNSHGIQLRNDLSFQPEYEFSENQRIRGPVLEPDHLSLFSNFTALQAKLKELPSEWTAVQISLMFDPLLLNDLVKSSTTQVNSIHIARFYCGDLSTRCPPYHVTVETASDESIISSLSSLMDTRRQAYKNWSDRKLRETYKSTDQLLQDILLELETGWLKVWKCLLTGTIQDAKLESDVYQRVKGIIKEFDEKQKVKSCSAVSVDVAYCVALNAHEMTNTNMMKALLWGLRSSGHGEVGYQDLFPLTEKLKAVNLRNGSTVKSTPRHPVILIVDNVLDIMPWEMISSLRDRPVTRVQSLHLLYALYKQHQQHISQGFRQVRVDSGFCLINPSQDLQDCEKRVSPFLRSEAPWVSVETGQAPSPKDLATRLHDFHFYMYCGHGSGAQYLKGELKRTPVEGLVLLFGCSSNLPRSAGGRSPFQNDTYTYLLNGCPCLVGCLYDLTSSDADASCLEIISNILPTITIEGSKIMLHDPKEGNVLAALISGKSKCEKLWSQSSFVARGIPCVVRVTQDDRRAILAHMCEKSQ